MLVEKWLALTLKTKYFLIMVIIVGTMGIWLPFLVDLAFKQYNYGLREVTLNAITYCLAIIVTNFIDFTMKVKKFRDPKVPMFHAFAGLGIVMLFVFIAIIFNYNYPAQSFIFSLISVMITLSMWWFYNKGNETFEPYTVLPGGNFNDD